MGLPLLPSPDIRDSCFQQKESIDQKMSHTQFACSLQNALGYGNPVDYEIEVLCRKGLLDEAFSRLDGLSKPTSHGTLILFLKACARLGSLPHTRQMHHYFLRNEVSLQGSLGEQLVSTLAKCGSFQEAYSLLDKLPSRTSLSWSSLISALVDHGNPKEALSVYARMLKDGVATTSHTFATLFRACGLIPDPQMGRELHEIARIRGVTSTVFIGNVLISMYKKFGNVLDAENVFSEMPKRDHISWNSMFSAYLDHGKEDKALLLYRQMQMEGWHPNPQSCVLALQACGLLADKDETNQSFLKYDMCKYLNMVHALHSDAKRFNFDTHPFVGTTLVTMYGKYGTILEAEHVASNMTDQDVVSWTAMFSAYGHQGQGTKALQLYKKMLEEGMDPDSRAFAIALQACEAVVQEDTDSTFVSLQIVRALHRDAWSKGMGSDPILGSSLVTLYKKCGTIEGAELVFSDLPNHDITVWTAMVSAYLDDGQGEKAIRVYRQMLAEGIRPDSQAFATALQACSMLLQEEHDQLSTHYIQMRSLHIVQGLHVDACRGGHASDRFVSNMLIGTYSKCGALAEAENVFTTIVHPDAMLWFRMLTAYLDQCKGERALQLFKFMQESGTHPNTQTFLVAVQACSLLALNEETAIMEGRFVKVRSLELGEALLVDAKRDTFDSDVFVASALVNLLGKCGNIEEAENVCTALSKPDVVLWTAMVSAYVEQGQGEKVLEVYRQMQSDCPLPLDEVIIICILQACGKIGNLEVVQHLHFVIGFSGLTVGGFLSSALAYAYGSCARIEDIQATFDVLIEPDLVTSNACIAGYAGEGNLIACEQMAQEMHLIGCQPDEVTFVSLLSACSHVGLVYRGLEFVECLRADYQLILDLKHYSTLLDLLGRAGDFNRLENLLQNIHLEADLAGLLCLLGACRIHGNVTLARKAFDIVLDMQSDEAAPYLLMSKIYAEAGMHDLAQEVESLRPQFFKDRVAWQELD
ncbi:hypothetical protein KP509_02G037400 [Ceratopteris richardii]|nr:hypothetical protein KP509_02G037400 [Ceratopteris richardii]